MKLLFILHSILIVSIGIDLRMSQVTSLFTDIKSSKTDTTYIFPAQPDQGFNFDYVIYLPDGINFEKTHTLLVESTNTGSNDTLEYHKRRAVEAASLRSLGNFVSRKLRTPFLVPVFPRPRTNWQYYTHALDSDTFNETGSDIERLDLQLLAMIDDAVDQLKTLGLTIDKQFFMVGFSASGTFANRFALLHPDRIKAVAAGGFNGILILPLSQAEEIPLPFPLGIADIEHVTGARVKVDSFKKLPQFWFMGENDDNDAVEYDDGYTQTEREIVHQVLDKEMMPARWEIVQDYYRKNGVQALFKTYKNIGHATDLTINNDIVDFFRNHDIK